jgi:hypothetical protein
MLPINGKLNFAHIAAAPPVLAAKMALSVLQQGHMKPRIFSTTPKIFMLVLWQKFISFLTSLKETS